MSRIISIALTAVLLLSLLCGCAGRNESGGTGTASENGASQIPADGGEGEKAFDPADTSVDGRTHFADIIEAKDFGAWDMVVGNTKNDPGYTFVAEEMTGEILNDAIYERNQRIETKYNITITENTDGGTSHLKGQVKAGSNDVAMYFILLDGAASYVHDGYIRSVSSMPAIDLTMPYWDQGSQKTLAFNDILYFGLNDTCFNHYESMATLFYNGQIITDFALDDPYQLFLEDKWTIDAMRTMAETVSADLNGDGTMKIKSDRFGFAGRNFENLPWLYASDTNLLAPDETTGGYVYNLNSDTVISVGEKIVPLVNNADIAYVSTDYAIEAFTEGHVLFMGHQLNMFRSLRTADDDYGIICFPGVTGSRETCQVYVQNPYTIMIPSTCLDNEADRLGLILEAWAADSYDQLIVPYFEYAVIGKGTRDENSAEMLRIMREIRAYDLCYALDAKVGIEGWNVALKKGNGYASNHKKFASKVEKKTEKAVEALSRDPFLGD